MRMISDFGFRISDFLKFAIRISQFAIFILLLCSCSQVFLQVRVTEQGIPPSVGLRGNTRSPTGRSGAPKSRYALKRLAILPFSVSFETAEPQSSVKRPLNLGFSQSEVNDPIGVKKIPATLEEKERIWFGEYSRVKLFVGAARARALVRKLTSKCYEEILRRGASHPLVNPDRVMEKLQKQERQDVESGKLSASDLKRMGRAMGAGTLLVGSITRYETDVTRHAYKAHERHLRKDESPKDVTQLRYIYRCALSISLFDVASSTFVWTGEAQANYNNITDDLAQDFTLALSGATGWGEFMKNHFLYKIAENTPLEQCLKGILAKMPR